jgi:hypothetical protein
MICQKCIHKKVCKHTTASMYACENYKEKKEPKQPIKWTYPFCLCPACGGSVYLGNIQDEIVSEEVSYCEHCGQAILWEVDTE